MLKVKYLFFRFAKYMVNLPILNNKLFVHHFRVICYSPVSFYSGIFSLHILRVSTNVYRKTLLGKKILLYIFSLTEISLKYACLFFREVNKKPCFFTA